MRRKRRKRVKKIRKIVVSRGGIQLAIIFALFLGNIYAVSCTLKHKLLPTTIDVNSIEILTDSISPSDEFLMFN